jgi:hypothetical protein
VDEIFKLHDDAEVSTRSEIEEEAEAKTATWATTEETTGEGKCDKCKLTDRLRDWSNEAKYRKLEYDAISERFDFATLKENVKNAKTTKRVDGRNLADKFHRAADEKRKAGKAIEEGKTRIFNMLGDDGNPYIVIITKGTVEKSDPHKPPYEGTFEYYMDDKKVITHEFFREQKCKKTNEASSSRVR